MQAELCPGRGTRAGIRCLRLPRWPRTTSIAQHDRNHRGCDRTPDSHSPAAEIIKHQTMRKGKPMDTLEPDVSHRPAHISPEEWKVRVDLAACYRLIKHFGWDDLVLTHNSARVPGTTDQMLINAWVVIHGAIYLGRPDVQCVVHTHTEADIAVGALEEGLLPLSQWAMRFYNRLGYHDYEGVSLDMDERERLQQSIGEHPVLVLRNHGLLATGRNVAEAFSLTYHFERSAEAQLKIQAAVAAGAKMVVPSPDTCARQAAMFAGNMPRLQGQREWPALLRMLDRIDPSYRS